MLCGQRTQRCIFLHNLQTKGPREDLESFFPNEWDSLPPSPSTSNHKDESSFLLFCDGALCEQDTSSPPDFPKAQEASVSLSEGNTWATLPGGWRFSQALKLLLDTGLPAEGFKEKQQGTAQGLLGGSPFISSGTVGPSLGEISPRVLETRAPGTEERGPPYSPFFSKAGSVLARMHHIPLAIVLPTSW